MDLLSSFDFLGITAADPSQPFRAAANEVLTLWQSRETIPVLSFCFYASADQRHVEIPIAWFKRHLERDSSKRSVRLHVDDHREPSSEHRWTRPRWRASLTRRMLTSRTRTIFQAFHLYDPETYSNIVLDNPAVSPMDSFSRRQSRNTSTTEESEAGRWPHTDVSRLRYLDIVFNRSSGRHLELSVCSHRTSVFQSTNDE